MLADVGETGGVRVLVVEDERRLAAAEQLTDEFPDLAPFLVGLLRRLKVEG